MNSLKRSCRTFRKPQMIQFKRTFPESPWWGDPMWESRPWLIQSSANNDSLSAIFPGQPVIQSIRWSRSTVDDTSSRIRLAFDDVVKSIGGLKAIAWCVPCERWARSDVAVLVLDGVEGVTEQDTKIAGLINKQGRGCIILVNKWDLRAGDREAYTDYNLELARRFPFFTHVPVLFGAGIQPGTLTRLFPKIDQVVADFSKRIQTRKLNLFVQELLEKNPMTLVRGNPKKSAFITQVATKPPTFALFIKSAQKVPASYLRYLENSIRTEYGFEGIPLRILLRSH